MIASNPRCSNSKLPLSQQYTRELGNIYNHVDVIDSLNFKKNQTCGKYK